MSKIEVVFTKIWNHIHLFNTSLCKEKLSTKRKYVPNLAPPKSGMGKETILREISQVPFWWHSIELGCGVITPGHQGGADDPWVSHRILDILDLPRDLTSKSVLDIGAWDGFFSFEAEKRGASRILAIDNFYRLKKEGKHLDSKIKGFQTAKKILCSNVEYKIMDVYELDPDVVGRFDITLFLGVFYHLKHLLLALERISSVTNDMLVVESYFINKWGNEPVAQFFEGEELDRDPTNWWGANSACIEAMIRSSGFKRVECIAKRATRIFLKAYKK